MNLQQCYAALEGDYDGVVARLHGERLVHKFALKFLDDPSYATLCTAIDDHDQPTAFRMAHTLKGVCQNLSFDKLFHSSHALTEALRDQWSDDVPTLFAQVQADYQQTVDALKALEQ